MFHFTKAGFKVGIPILYAHSTWMRSFSKHPDKKPLKYRYLKLQSLLKKISNAFDVEYIVEGKENIPEGVCYFVSNHLSFFDPLAIISNIDKPMSVVAKKEVAKMPFVGYCVQCISGEFLNRNDLKQNLKVMSEMAKDLTEQKKSWLIFPEGTRLLDPLKNCLEFHYGSFKPATKSKCPIIPIALYGTPRVLKLKNQYKKYPVFIKILEPIYPNFYSDMTTKDLAKYVQDKIQKTISFELRKKDNEYMTHINKSNYGFNKID